MSKACRCGFAALVLGATHLPAQAVNEARIAKDFELALARKIDSVQKARVIWQFDSTSEYRGKFGRVQCAIQNVLFDVQKTASLVTPYSAPVSFEIAEMVFSPEPDSIGVLLAKPDGHAPFWARLSMVFRWRDGTWRYGEGRAQFLPIGRLDSLLFKGSAVVPMWPGGPDEDGALSVVYARCINKAAWSTIQ